MVYTYTGILLYSTSLTLFCTQGTRKQKLRILGPKVQKKVSFHVHYSVILYNASCQSVVYMYYICKRYVHNFCELNAYVCTRPENIKRSL